MNKRIRRIKIANNGTRRTLRRIRRRPQTARIRYYQPPSLVLHGELGSLIRGASWKGVDSVGELDPDNSYPG